MARKKGRSWYTDFMINRVRYRQRIPEARTKQEAIQAEIKIRRDLFEGKYGVERKPVAFVEFVEKTFLKWSKDSEKPSHEYNKLTARVLCEFFKGKTFDQISPFQVEAFKKHRRETPKQKYDPETKRRVPGTEARAPASINRELAVLSRIFSLAMKEKIITSNPCHEVKPLRADNRRTRYLSADEETRLMLALEHDTRAHITPIVIVALHTGMRRGEILNLRWADVDASRSVIHIHRTKTNRPRQIPMNAILRDLLASLPREGEHVFVSKKTGARIVEIKRAFNSACREAEIEDFHFHDLRHTAATRWADAGADAFTISQLLGHSTIQMSARYTHATDAALLRAVESSVSRDCHPIVTNEKRQVVRLPLNR